MCHIPSSLWLCPYLSYVAGICTQYSRLTKTPWIFYKILGVILLAISGQSLTKMQKVDVEQCSYAELVGRPKRGCGG